MAVLRVKGVHYCEDRKRNDARHTASMHNTHLRRRERDKYFVCVSVCVWNWPRADGHYRFTRTHFVINLFWFFFFFCCLAPPSSSSNIFTVLLGFLVVLSNSILYWYVFFSCRLSSTVFHSQRKKMKKKNTKTDEQRTRTLTRRRHFGVRSFVFQQKKFFVHIKLLFSASVSLPPTSLSAHSLLCNTVYGTQRLCVSVCTEMFLFFF